MWDWSKNPAPAARAAPAARPWPGACARWHAGDASRCSNLGVTPSSAWQARCHWRSPQPSGWQHRRRPAAQPARSRWQTHGAAPGGPRRRKRLAPPGEQGCRQSIVAAPWRPVGPAMQSAFQPQTCAGQAPPVNCEAGSPRQQRQHAGAAQQAGGTRCRPGHDHARAVAALPCPSNAPATGSLCAPPVQRATVNTSVKMASAWAGVVTGTAALGGAQHRHPQHMRRQVGGVPG
jgi:hypothetical protein